MRQMKRLQELTIKDNFMSGAVMLDEELPDTYVIFICDYDPFGSKKYRYTFENMCLEESELKLVDGMHSVFLSTHGENEEEVPIELVKFLRYVRANLNESTEDFEDTYVKRLQESVQNIKKSREMGERYMILHEMLKDEREAGKQEGLAESILYILEDLGEVPENLRQQILTEKDPNILKKYLQQAVKAESIDQFIEAIS